MLILHGEDLVASRNEFLTVRARALTAGSHPVDLMGSDLVQGDLTSAVEAVSLLGHVNTVFIENFFTRRPGREKTAITQYLLTRPGAEIFIWEGKDVTPSLKDFPPDVIKKYDLPKYIWKFLDTLNVADYRLALKSAPPEQILALLSGQLHKMIMAKTDRGALPSWQLSKLKKQSLGLSVPDLAGMIQELLEIDFGAKTSSLPYDLSTAIELWLIKLNNKY